MKIIAIAAMSINGKINHQSNNFTNWTCPEDKHFLRKLLNKCDVIIVGNNTYKSTQKILSKRNCIVLTSSSKKTYRDSKKTVYFNPRKTKLLDLMSRCKLAIILGGTQTYTYCLENSLIDELYITVEPLVFGQGLNIFDSKKAKITRFHLISISRLNDSGSILLHYKKN